VLHTVPWLSRRCLDRRVASRSGPFFFWLQQPCSGWLMGYWLPTCRLSPPMREWWCSTALFSRPSSVTS